MKWMGLFYCRYSEARGNFGKRYIENLNNGYACAKGFGFIFSL